MINHLLCHSVHPPFSLEEGLNLQPNFQKRGRGLTRPPRFEREVERGGAWLISGGL